MANLVTTNLSIEGRPHDLEKIKNLLQSEVSIFDFNRIIPLTNLDESEDKWGCRGLALNLTRSNRTSTGFLHYNFDTRWAAPYPAIQALSRRYANTIMLLRTAGEFDYLNQENESAKDTGLYLTPVSVFKGGVRIVSFYHAEPHYSAIRKY